MLPSIWVKAPVREMIFVEESLDPPISVVSEPVDWHGRPFVIGYLMRIFQGFEASLQEGNDDDDVTDDGDPRVLDESYRTLIDGKETDAQRDRRKERKRSIR